MGLLSRLVAWLNGDAATPTGTFTKRMMFEGVGLEHFYVFAKGREASLEELMVVFNYVVARASGGEKSGARCSTERYDPRPGETEAAIIKRIANESADKHPGMAVLAFAWPDLFPTVIVAMVTVGKLRGAPFSEARATACEVVQES